jgi:eukaryotic-like serine/threonine-protein kinase
VTMTDHDKATLGVGMVLDDKWVILEFIGKGGMGEVYRAHQLNLKRDAAIKIISQEWLNSFDCDTEELENSLERFHREVQVMAQIQHPNVLQIFDQGSAKIRKGESEHVVEYIAMEYVPGSSLRAAMSEEGFSPEEELTVEWLTTYFLPLLDGVRVLHGCGIVHRDLKPENVLLAGNTPKIADFGLASSCSLKPITLSVHMMGTPPYMPQEQFLDMRRTDHRADVYALGKILYEALDGKMTSEHIPFKQVQLKNPRGTLFNRLNQIIRHATAEDKNERLPTTEEMSHAVRQALKDHKPSPPAGRTETDESDVVVPKGSSQLNKWIILFTVMVVVAVAGAAGIFVLGERRGEKAGDISVPVMPDQKKFETSREPDRSSSQKPVVIWPSDMPVSIKGEDEGMLNLIPGGEVIFPESFQPEGSRQVRVDSFYMDIFPVTNHQYVEYLNQVLTSITVDNGVVKGDGKIWLILGEVIAGYEPIEYRDGNFHMKAAHHATCPVLRVTGYGAAAYSRYYNKRLPTDIEWYYALRTVKSLTEDGSASLESDKSLPIISPVMVYQPNVLGIRGLNANIGEWGIRHISGDEENAGADYVLLGEIFREKAKGTGFPTPLSRYPWEAFEKVGFRSVIDGSPKPES